MKLSITINTPLSQQHYQATLAAVKSLNTCKFEDAETKLKAI